MHQQLAVGGGVVAVAGEPLEDITELERVTWVMKAGVVWKAP